MPGPQSWSTADLPPSKRFAHWREVRAKTIFGVSIELDRRQRGIFRGAFSVQSVGGASVIEMHASPYSVQRTENDIARTRGDALCIYQQLDGGGWFEAGGAEFVVSTGLLATSHSDLPYRTVPTTEAGFHLRLIKIPFDRCKALIGGEQDLPARPVHVEPGVTALFANYVESFVAQAPHLHGVGAELAVDSLAHLAILARGMTSSADDRGREAIRAGLLQKARQIIENRKHRPDLSPAMVASLLGVSVRQLHLLFEPSGTTFARHVLACRLAYARELLIRCPQRPIVDIAFASGFDSISTFYRNFRAAHGQSPVEFRASAPR